MTDRDPISRLQALGTADVPPPSEDVVDVLVGARLPHRDPSPAPRRHVVRFPVVLPAAALRAALEGSTTTTAPTAPGASNAAPAWEKLPIAVDLEARRTANGDVTFVWSAYKGTDALGFVVVREDRTVVARRRVGGVREAAD